MVSRSIIITLTVLIMATLSFGQFNVGLHSIEQALTDVCGSGDPLPDGATVLIYHDNIMPPSQIGPDPTDFQPTVGESGGNVNYNSFSINGNMLFDMPGTFSMASVPFSSWTSVGYVPTPDWFYLVVCYGDVKYYSSSIIVSDGYQEFEFGPSGITWNCLDENCGLELPPPAPLHLTATEDLCNGIEISWDMNWEYLGGDIHGWLIYRGATSTPMPIDTVWFDQLPEPPFTYFDVTAPVGVIKYWVASIRRFENDTLVSGRSYFKEGNRLPGPPIPIVEAISTDSCGGVNFDLSVNLVAGLDEVRAYRIADPDDILIGVEDAITAGHMFRIIDENPLPGPQQYYAVGVSELCGEGMHTDTVVGEALLVPQGALAITETEETCDAVCLTWTYDSDDADGFVLRKNTTQLTDTVWADETFNYCDETAVAGQQTGYRVIAFNQCGNGAESDPVIGIRLDVPDVPTEVAATTDDCECVYITWTDPEGELTELTVYRDGSSIGTADPGDEEFEDCDVDPNTNYVYHVTATNECGDGEDSGTATGSLGVQDGGTATLAMTVQGPPNWDYSLTWTSGCVSKLTIRSLCDGTTASFEGTADWTVQLYDEGDSVVFWTETEPLSEGVLTGFRLTNSTGCSGEGTWTAGSDGGTIEGPLPINRNLEMPTEYSLAVYPNPFNPTTNLEFAIPKSGLVTVNVYDVSGRLVKEIVNDAFSAGYHAVSFDGTGLPSGLYFARVSADNFVATKKLMLLK